MREACSCNSDSLNRVLRGLRQSRNNHSPICSVGSGMDGVACFHQTALFCFIMAYAPEKADAGVFETSFLESFPDSMRKTVALTPGVCYTDGAYTIPEWH